MDEKLEWYSFRFQMTAVFVIPVLIAFITPSLIIFFLEVFVGQIAPLTSLRDIAYRQFASGENLFLLTLFSSIPFAVLVAILFCCSLCLTRRRVWCLSIGGLAGILGLMVPAHISVWFPLYGPGRMSSTAVIAFLFIPFYCIPPMLAGVGIGWAVSLLPWFQKDREKFKRTMNVIRKLRRYGINIFCWLVKGYGIAVLLLLLAIFIGEGPPNPFKLTAEELFFMLVLLTTLIGLALAVWRQLIGGIVVLAGVVVFTILGGIEQNWVFYAFWKIGLLNILCWFLKKFLYGEAKQ